MTDIVERLQYYTPYGPITDMQADAWMKEAADEIERLRKALRGIEEADCEAIKLNGGVVCLKPGPYAIIARATLGEEK